MCNMNILPKLSKIKIPEKLTKYALNTERQPDKALAFKLALGYDLSNYKMLIDNIYQNIDKYEATAKGDFGHGMQYEVIMNLTGAHGRCASVLTAWIDDVSNDEMRLITVHIDKTKGGTANV